MNYKVDLHTKVALVTGGSRGLGRAMSLGLAEAGAAVVVASRNLESCAEVVAAIRRKGGRALAVAADAADTASLDRLIDETWNEFSRLDILINNAGTNCGFKGLDQISVAEMDHIYQVNLRGPWYLASRAAPRMAEHGGGCMINIISVAALRPIGYLGPYAATKAGLHALTKVMAQEWAPLGIRVNALAPGSYHSDLFDRTADAVPGFEENSADGCFMKRIAETEEILGPILYLVSEASAYTTGACIVADGGTT